jgi:hypothetical protein
LAVVELQADRFLLLRMSFAKKFLVYLVLIVAACVLAGLFGIVHDQITYSVSPEYYTKFKFIQFHLLDSPLPERLRAVIAGFLASWWMGIPIGLLVGAVGFIHRGPQRMLVVSLRSFVLVVVFTLLDGLIGLGYVFFQTSSIDLASYRGWFIPPNVIDLRRYLCVGYMHNASYIGGALSIVAAWIYHVVVRVRANGV